MKIVIVDNEINALNYLVNILNIYENITIEKTFTDSVEALVYLLKNQCDAIFLDIEMPSINGMYLAEQVINLYPETRICFVTAYNDFAIKAFEINAIDYILKPFTESRIENSIKRMMNLPKNNTYNINEISNSYEYELEMICGFNNEEIVLISYDEIFYIEMLNRKVFIHLKNNIYTGNKTLNFYEEKLKKRSFFRSHKCYIVNLAKIDRFKPRINYTYDMYFKEIDDVIPLSRNKVKQLKMFFNI
ncbi:LytR/AlgR family response regulator transcription factor [Clostridium kluyveri]|uniref:Stage 0 sporulation protein A homolog n=1 Tax=Clostridium kluyveri TaxID=1534 RepID=A0A1L5FAQ4_CLOKL|nr:LytTR family DNA-binding domain-containing protein [Clostridium kluyveri]APM40084.1 DNA-binding response regulator [Clostridium kluyveri]UZQ49675.1 LytTR family DNA-binding domain-containing protein [Clostridium kluyveri]